MNFYISRNNEDSGPHSIDQIKTQIENGELTRTDLIWEEGWESWLTVESVPGLVPVRVSLPPKDPSTSPAPFQPLPPGPVPVANPQAAKQADGNPFVPGRSTLKWLIPIAILFAIVAAASIGSVFYAQRSWTNSLGLKFVPAGTPGVLFCIYDVRVKDYQQFVTATGREWETPISPLGSFAQSENDPAVMVSWNDAEAFCAWLTQKEQSAGLLGSNQSYR